MALTKEEAAEVSGYGTMAALEVEDAQRALWRFAHSKMSGQVMFLEVSQSLTEAERQMALMRTKLNEAFASPA